MNKFNDDTCFLFADPSFLSGMATVMDIGGGMLVYNKSRSGTEADERAIASDWAVIGGTSSTQLSSWPKEARHETSGVIKLGPSLAVPRLA